MTTRGPETGRKVREETEMREGPNRVGQDAGNCDGYSQCLLRA